MKISWVYLVFFNVLWVFFPLWVLYESYCSLTGASPVENVVHKVQEARKTKQWLLSNFPILRIQPLQRNKSLFSRVLHCQIQYFLALVGQTVYFLKMLALNEQPPSTRMIRYQVSNRFRRDVMAIILARPYSGVIATLRISILGNVRLVGLDSCIGLVKGSGLPPTTFLICSNQARFSRRDALGAFIQFPETDVEEIGYNTNVASNELVDFERAQKCFETCITRLGTWEEVS